MPAVPTLPPFSPGIVSPTDLGLLAQALAFMMKPPMAEVRQDVAQSIPTGVWTALTFTAEDWDSDISGLGGHSNSVNTSRWVCQYPGWYELSGGCGFAVSAVGVRGLYWAINGVAQTAAQVLVSASSAFESAIPARSKKVYFGAFDYVELLSFQSTAGALLTSIAGSNAANMSIKFASVQ